MSTDKGPVALPGERSLRTSDIATEVGVHANTVRLYEEWGYLPPIPRTEAGYRQFNSIHLAQMKLARLAFADPFPGRRPVCCKLSRTHCVTGNVTGPSIRLVIHRMAIVAMGQRKSVAYRC